MKKNSKFLILINILILFIFFNISISKVFSITDTVYYFSFTLKDGNTYNSDGYNLSKDKNALQKCEKDREEIIKTELFGGNEDEKNTKCFYKTVEVKKVDESEVIDPSKNKNVTKSDNIYTFLAPIGETKCMDNTGQNKECISNDIGEYLGFIFRFLIGVAAALAIIMLIIAGITYMGDESVFGKTEAKNKMFKAVLGLLIALGSYALLNTINPDLTGSKGFTVDKVEVEIDNEVELTPYTEYNKGDSLKLCTGGFVDTIVKGTTPAVINTCESIKKDLVNLINDAKKDNIILSGYGSRSSLRQQQLRVAHGCPNPDTPSKECKPETARPGRSMHESGKAIDFTCNGKSIMETGGKKSECYIWLTKNAKKYGLINLSSEPWHWSTNGK